MTTKFPSSEPVRTAISADRRARRLGRSTLVTYAWCIALLGLSGGCTKMAITWAWLTGGETSEPEFKLGQGPLLIFIDDIDGLITEPRAVREVYTTLVENLAHFKLNNKAIPFEEWSRLKQSQPDYDDLKIRQVGEKLGAEQVLYLRVTRFALQNQPGADVFQGEFAVKVKVLSTEQKRDIRLWPHEEGGRKVTATTKPEPMDGDKTTTDVSNELSIKLGQEVAKLFYGHKPFER